MYQLEDLNELRNSCPPNTNLVGPTNSAGLQIDANDRVTATCMRPDGSRHGPSITWYTSGLKAMAGDYQDNLKVGVWSFWYENGQISGRGNFCNGKPDGVWVTNHENGQKESEGAYLEGLQDGCFTHWNCNGDIVKVLHYKQGNLIKNIPYRNGSPID